MALIFKIAWRNIFRHKGKSLVIGIILFLGALLMTAGNGVISGMNNGLVKNIVNGFTGDIILVSDKQESDNVFLTMMGRAVEPINNYPQIKKVLASQGYLKSWLPAGKNMVMILNEEGGSPGFAFVLGVDFSQYKAMFPGNIRTIEGKMLVAGERGVLLPQGSRKQYYDLMNTWYITENDTVHTANLTEDAKKNSNELITKDNIVFMGFNGDNSASDIRLSIKGIVKYNALNTIWGHFALMDIESYRQCLGYFAAAEKTATIRESEKKLLDMKNSDLDALFGSDVASDEKNKKKTDTDNSKQKTEISSDTAASTQPVQAVNLEEGTYNLVMVLLKDGVQQNQALTNLNAVLKKEGCNVRAISWQKATGQLGSLSMLIKSALFVFVMFLFFVAIIIIINTLSMAALERTSEIGMMRAVGARKGFISTMFIAETGLLSFFFGGLGTAAGILAVNICSRLNITSDNDMVQLIFGGDTFRPLLSTTDIMLVIIQLALVTFIAVIYPQRVARRITPLEAIARE